MSCLLFISGTKQSQSWSVNVFVRYGMYRGLSGQFTTTYESCSLHPIQCSVIGALSIIAVFQVLFQHRMGLTLFPNQVYDNYRKDLLINQYYDCSYEQYMEHVIDFLVDSTEVDWNGAQDTSPEIFTEHKQDVTPTRVDTSKNAVSLSEGQDTSLSGKIGVSSPKGVNKIRIVDKNFPDKKTGFIALERDNFEFIGPDREEVCIHSIDKCLKISRIIRDTNEPNYKIAH